MFFDIGGGGGGGGRGVSLVRKGVKGVVLVFHGQTRKITRLSTGEMGILPYLDLSFHLSPLQKKYGSPSHLLFQKGTEIELSSQNVFFWQPEICRFWKDLKICCFHVRFDNYSKKALCH